MTEDKAEFYQALEGWQRAIPSKGYYASHWTHLAGWMRDQIEEALGKIAQGETDIVFNLSYFRRDWKGETVEYLEGHHVISQPEEVRYWIDMSGHLDLLSRPVFGAADLNPVIEEMGLSGKYGVVDQAIEALARQLMESKDA
jgi:hypothetical protein